MQDLGDARSRLENSRHRDLMERGKASAPEYAYAPRWVPTANWRSDLGDLILHAVGWSIILLAVGLHWLGWY